MLVRKTQDRRLQGAFKAAQGSSRGHPRRAHSEDPPSHKAGICALSIWELDPDLKLITLPIDFVVVKAGDEAQLAQ